MSFADDDELAAFIGRDDWLPMVTGDAVASALDGFALKLSRGRNMDWLAMAVRRSLAISIQNVSDGPERTSNFDIRAELERLAGMVEATRLQLFKGEGAANPRVYVVYDALWRLARRDWDGEGGTDIGDGLVMGEPSDFRRFKAAVSELEWLASFMREAAMATESELGPWRQSEGKRLRVMRGQYLAPIYEAAFGRSVSANNWPSGTHRKPSAYMDFYQRMVALAFGELATPNISSVLKTACQLHRQHPAECAEGIVPRL